MHGRYAGDSTGEVSVEHRGHNIIQDCYFRSFIVLTEALSASQPEDKDGVILEPETL